jgi:hypothetical protein
MKALQSCGVIDLARYRARKGNLICALLLTVVALLAPSFAIAQISYTYRMKNGSSLTISSVYGNPQGWYKLCYTQPDGSANIVWNSPDNNGVLTLSDVRSAYISDGRITALFDTGGAARVLVIQVPETPGAGASRVVVLSGLLSGSFVPGQSGREELQLTDHNHFEIVGQGGTNKRVFVDPQKGVATVNGKPVETLPFYMGVIGQPPPPEPPPNSLIPRP